MVLIVILMVLMVIIYSILGFIFRFGLKQGETLRLLFLNYVFIPICNIDITFTGDASVDRPAIFVSNHRSLVDVVIFRYFYAIVIAKAEIEDYPFLNRGTQQTGVIFVKRDDKNSRNSVKEGIKKVLLDGYHVGVFPEGTVSVEQHTLPFKKGSFDIAAELGAPVKPAAIEYRHKEDLWTQPSMFVQFLKVFSRWKTEVKIHIGPAMTGDDGAELAARAEQYVNEKLHEMQVGWSTVFPHGAEVTQPVS